MKPKQKKHKTQLPRSPLAFYIKLYCDRKGSTKTKYHNNLIEATQSWLSLTEIEKKQFTIKYQECEEKFRSVFFDQLKSAEPYMKAKVTSSKSIEPTVKLAIKKQEEPTKSIEAEVVQTEPIDAYEHSTSDTEEVNTVQPSTPLEVQEQNENIKETVNETPHTILVEPLPPTVKTGHELYCMFNSTNESNSITWTSVARFEKNRYSRAVSIMKKDYIAKYKEYLESLTPKELFDYYNKTIFDSYFDIHFYS